MTLARTQELLSRLYTDADLRRRFFADPEAVGREWHVEPSAARQIAAESRQQITAFARSLHRKRMRGVRRLLPRTAEHLGDAFAARFLEYADTYVPSGTRKIPGDALAFAGFLRRSEPLDERLAGVLRWESAWIRARDPRFRWAVRWFRRGSDGSGRACLAVWWRWGRRGHLRHFIVPRLSPKGGP